MATPWFAVSLLSSLLPHVIGVPYTHRVSSLAKRGEDSPGLGVELELPDIRFEPKNGEYTREMYQVIKDSDIWPKSVPKRDLTNWRLTAEAPPTFGRPYVEIIVDGRANKLQDGNMDKIAAEIKLLLNDWKPGMDNNPPQFVDVEGVPPVPNQWIVITPNHVQSADELTYRPQVTAPLPLDAVQKLLSAMKKNEKDNCFVNEDMASSTKDYVIVSKDDFDDFDKIKLDDEVFGFFSWLSTYCSYAGRGDQGENARSPKHDTSLMPRTSFLDMFNSCIKSKIAEQLKCDSLFDIVSKISGQGDKLADKEFTWPAKNVVLNTPVDWNTKTQDLASKKLKVKQFLDHLEGRDGLKQADLLAAMDQACGEAQIGRLKDRKERIISSWDFESTKACAPILEIRNVKQFVGTGLAKSFEGYEAQIKRYHSESSIDTTLDPIPTRRDLSASTDDDSCKNKRKKCAKGQLSALIKGTRQCTDKCPDGQKKNAAGDGCDLDCPKGQKPNATGDKCETDSDNKCKEGEATIDGKCQQCPGDKKPGPDGKTCDPKTDDDDKKNKDKEEKKKRIKRAGYCMAFVGVALGGIEGVDFTSDEGAALILSEAQSFADNEWNEADIPFKDYDLGDMNIEPEYEPELHQTGKQVLAALNSPIQDGLNMTSAGLASTNLTSPNLASTDTLLNDGTTKDVASKGLAPANSASTDLVTTDPATTELATLERRSPQGIIRIIGQVGRFLINLFRRGGKALRQGGKGRRNEDIANQAAKTGKSYKCTKNGAGGPSKVSEQAGKEGTQAKKPGNFGDKMNAIKNNKSFKDCLGIAAFAAVGTMAIRVADEIPKDGYKAEENSIVVTMMTNKNNKGGFEATLQTYNDGFFHGDRLTLDTCMNLKGEFTAFDNQISGYEVVNGCCRFYKDPDCKGALFSAFKRKDEHLKGQNNDAISSLACNFDAKCNGLPS